MVIFLLLILLYSTQAFFITNLNKNQSIYPSNLSFLIAVLITIYNTEEYLCDCVDSVIHQTIGFQQNIQIILVNDGSPDNSEIICLHYAYEQYKSEMSLAQITLSTDDHPPETL